MKRRIIFLASLLVLGLPVLAAGQEKEQSPSEPSQMQDVITMAQMRALVPRLMELGWDDFFLNPQLLNSLGENTPSPDQVRKFLSLQDAFLEARERARGKAMAASLALYREMNADQVSARQIETRLHDLSVLQGKLTNLRIQYLLRAINVLSHEQHRKLAGLLDSPFGPLVSPQSPFPPTAPRLWRPRGKMQLAQ